MPSVEDVFAGDLWFFPTGLPHSLQGLGPDGAEFVLAFDDGAQSESNTLLLTDWIFPGDEPGDLEADQVAAGVEWGSTTPVIFRLSESRPVHENSGGSIRIADSTNFSASKTVAAALVTVKPGSMRERAGDRAAALAVRGRRDHLIDEKGPMLRDLRTREVPW